MYILPLLTNKSATTGVDDHGLQLGKLGLLRKGSESMERKRTKEGGGGFAVADGSMG